MVQLSHLYMTTGKTTALTIQIFVSKVMSLLFKTLSRFIIAFLPRGKLLLLLLLSLQSCLTLCNPRDSSPPSSSVPRILQARTLEWIAISFSNA